MIRLNELEDNARRFLSRWGMRIEDLKHRAPDVAADECLILCSTIPEGLANQASDIDLIYIGSGDLKSAIRMNINKGVALDVSFDAAGREFNVNRISPEELGELAESIRSSIAIVEKPNFRNLTSAKVEREFARLMLLHRIRCGVPVVNPHIVFNWQERLQSDKLHLHLCLQNVLDYLNFEEDVVGELNDGHVASADWIARQSMAIRLTGALLASIGCTNVNVKWYRKLLDMHRDTFGAALVDRLLQFIASAPAPDAAALRASIKLCCAPVLYDIYRRLPMIKEASERFGKVVRYSTLEDAS